MQKYYFYLLKIETCVIPLFVSEKYICGIILLIQGHLQGRKIISKVKNVKICKNIFKRQNRKKCKMSLLV